MTGPQPRAEATPGGLAAHRSLIGRSVGGKAHNGLVRVARHQAVGVPGIGATSHARPRARGRVREARPIGRTALGVHCTSLHVPLVADPAAAVSFRRAVAEADVVITSLTGPDALRATFFLRMGRRGRRRIWRSRHLRRHSSLRRRRAAGSSGECRRCPMSRYSRTLRRR
jgi:hypothetical protein